MHVEVPPLPDGVLYAGQEPPGESSTQVRQRVEAARSRQLTRAGKANHRLSSREVERDCCLDERNRQLLARAIDGLGLSARAAHRIMRVARTIADLAESPGIETPHLSEAIGYRRLDRGIEKG